jgi:peptidoglycan/LPS O-acetylase OafA/YrhL
MQQLSTVGIASKTAPPAFPAPSPTRRPRLWSLDRLKVFLTLLVIAHHAGQAYGAGGFWVYENPERWPYLGFFFWVNASFFMGLFFFISAYFFPGSYDRKGAAAFLMDKALRFGLPLLIFALLVNPVLMYLSYINFRGGTLPFAAYYTQIYFGTAPRPAGLKGPGWPEFNVAHLWFIEHLLVYAVIYAAWRLAWRRPANPGQAGSSGDAPGDLAILLYAVGLTLVTMLVRTWYPVNKWVFVLGFIQMEPAHIPQYLSFFILGAIAMRRGWFQAIPKARGLRWLGAGIGATVAGALIIFRIVSFGPTAGLVLMSTAESFVAAGFLVGLCTLFRERFNAASPFWQTLGNDAYGAYLVHVPVVVGLQYAIGGMPAGPVPKFLLVTLVGAPLSFLISRYLRKMPAVSRVL